MACFPQEEAEGMNRRKGTEGEKQKDTGKNRIKRMVSLFFLLAAVLAALFIYRLYREDKHYLDRFKELKEIEEKNTYFNKKESENGNNPDWIGWFKIKDTDISYPVMQRQGDAEYYLRRDFDGAYSFYGTPFLDIRCTLDSDNCIIYGHNINGGRMFGALHAYAKERYYKKHPEIQFRAGQEKRAYEIISVIQTDISSPVYSFVDTGNHEEYRENVRKILLGSLYRTEMVGQIEKSMEEESKDVFFRKYQFLTLSTCRSWAGHDQRLLVVAAKERETEQ